MDTDRNLLFGLLALQLEYIDESQLVQACRAWAARKSVPLAELLVEQGWLDEQARRQVDDLLSRKMRRRRGSPRDVLGTVADADLRDLLRSVADDELQETLSLLAPPAGYVRVVDEPVSLDEERSHYALSRMHDEGGLGRVWVARDLRLHREVALKEIRPDNVSRPQSRQRFLREAQITGQLEHPNIVPVYELGQSPNSHLPFYTMPFVHGQDLSKAIEEYHRLRRTGEAGELELRRLLNAFLCVCNAVGYAHSKGVIHRDLKPSNVMLGAFGQVVVLDWGLAKAVHADEETPEGSSAAELLSPRGDPITLEGQAVGTPAYMSPEQAAGRLSEIDDRTDIYGLGAILFRILTGKRPHRGKSTQEILSGIRTGPTPQPRQVDSRVPPPLNAICARAMAKQPADRYPSAAALADDVQRWLADEPVSVYSEPWRGRLARWGRRHRTLASTALAGLLAVTAVILVAAILLNRAWQAEHAARTDEQRRFAQAVETVDRLTTGANQVLRDLPGAAALRLSLLQRAATCYEDFASLRSEIPQIRLEAARTWLRLGNLCGELGQHDPLQRERARQSYRRADEILRSLPAGGQQSAELDSALVVYHWKQAELLAEDGRADEARQQYQQAGEVLDRLPDSPQRLLQLAEVAVSRADFERRAGDPRAAERWLRWAADALAAETPESPGDTPDDPSLRSLMAELARVRSVLGSVLIERGRHDQAAEVLLQARSVYDRLLRVAGDSREYLEARAYAELSRAQALGLLGDPSAEIQAYEDAIADFEAVQAALLDIPHLRENLAIAHSGLGFALHRRYQNPRAVAHLDSALDEFHQLSNLSPESARYLEELAHTGSSLGYVLADLNNPQQAEQNLQSAITAYVGALMPRDPELMRYQRDTAIAGTALGLTAELQGDMDQAKHEYGLAAELLGAVVERDAGDTYARDARATALERLGDLLQEQGLQQAAQEHYAAALESRDPALLPQLPVYRQRRAALLLKFDQPAETAEAVEIARQLVEQYPEHGGFGVLLGAAYTSAGRQSEAVAVLSGIDPLRQPEAGPERDFWLAIAFAARGDDGDPEQAEQAYQRGLDAAAEQAPGAIPLRRLGQRAAAAVAAARH